MKGKTVMMGFVLCLFCMCVFSPVIQVGAIDADGSGELDSRNARVVLQYAVNSIGLSEKEVCRLDQNFDGVLDSTDARSILQKAVGAWQPIFWTEAANELPEKAETVEFTVRKEEKLPPSDYEGNIRLYLARSRADITAIISEIYQNTGAPGPALEETYDAAYFADHTVLVLECMLGAGTTTQRVDQILWDQGQLIVCQTLTDTSHPTPDLAHQYVFIELDNTQLDGVRSVACYIKWETRAE